MQVHSYLWKNIDQNFGISQNASDYMWRGHVESMLGSVTEAPKNPATKSPVTKMKWITETWFEEGLPFHD